MTIHRIGFMRMLSVALVSLILSADNAAARETRLITVTCAARDQGGEPLLNLPIVLESSAGAVATGTTNSDGVAVLSGAVPVADPVVGIATSGGDLLGLSEDERDTLLGTNIPRFLHSCFEMEYTIDLDPSVADYSIEIAAQGCVSISLSSVDQAGTPILCAACSSIAEPEESRMAAATAFVLRTAHARPGFVYLTSTQRASLLRVSQAQSATDIDLGAVTLGPRTNSGTLTITTTRVGELIAALRQFYFAGFVLVSMDGTDLYPVDREFLRDGEGNYVLRALSVPVPAGTFYVVPTGFLGPAWARALLDAIAAEADLTNSGVPTVTIEPNGSASVSIDVMAAYQALFRLRRYSTPQ